MLSWVKWEPFVERVGEKELVLFCVVEANIKVLAIKLPTARCRPTTSLLRSSWNFNSQQSAINAIQQGTCNYEWGERFSMKESVKFSSLVCATFLSFSLCLLFRRIIIIHQGNYVLDKTGEHTNAIPSTLNQEEERARAKKQNTNCKIKNTFHLKWENILRSTRDEKH